MVARINTLKNISKVLNYNEQKVQTGKAALLYASSFLKDASALSFYDKLWHFERQNALNEKVVTNTLHVSLNFDPTEPLASDKLVEIAKAYMDGIGFGTQPYLVYRHEDAGHPHIHIVTSIIRQDGSRISVHNLGRNQSETSRKEIEITFGLVKAEEKTMDSTHIPSINATKLTYGKSETRSAIANVLRTVLLQYNYVSLEGLNAVLKRYNVVADRGGVDSRMYQHGGIQYSVLDAEGNKVGTPINASRFFMKPTLPFLEKRFLENEMTRPNLRKKIKATLDWNLHKQPASLHDFISALDKDHIAVVLRKNKEGMVYGITYVDLKGKSVFNGSEIGKDYSAKSVLERCILKENLDTPVRGRKHMPMAKAADTPAGNDRVVKGSDARNFAAILIEPEFGTDQVPYPLKGKKKRKRRRMKF